MKYYVLIAVGILTCCVYGDVKKGETLFKTFCASCHGPEGAGLVGPNLTDKEILHGTEKKDIIKLKDTFDDYNNGEIGPGHCDDDFEGDDD